MADKAPTKGEILDVVGAQAATLKDLSERLVKLESIPEKLTTIESSNSVQEGRNQQVLYVVLWGLVIIVVSVAITVIFANRNDKSESGRTIDILNSNSDKMMRLQEKIDETSHRIDILKARNPYLK